MATKTVEDYLSGFDGELKKILEGARTLIKKAVPGIVESMKWGTPAYALPEGEPLFYLYGGKDHVNLGFLLGAQLDDPQELLEGAGKKDSRHVSLKSVADVKRPGVKRLIVASAKQK